MKSYLCTIIVFAGLIMLFSDYYLWSILLITIAFIFFILQNKRYWGKLSYFGVANVITTARFILVILLIFSSAKLKFDDSIVLIIIFIIPILDIIDGLVARHRKEESQFGMFYDMEVDAVFVMVASIMIYQNYTSMWIVLFPAFLRYFYKFFIDILDKKNKFIETKKKYASIVAGNYFVALIVFYFLNNEFASNYLKLSSILIVLSFGKSFYSFYKWSNELK